VTGSSIHGVPPGRGPDDWVGQVIDSRYRISGVLGSGGMGTVYAAEHVTIRRPMALKLLHPTLGASADIAARFEREAFAAGRVAHPNCVTVSDFGQLEDGTLYLVMELLDGLSLRALLERQAPLQVERALHITGHILRGLGHAHQLGVIHRDVKPDNVFLVAHGDDPDFAKLLDFGIAKLVGSAQEESGENQATQAGLTIGTPAYLAPEQAAGDAIDHRADLYSTAVVLFEMLAGHPPFRGPDKLATITHHLTHPVPDLPAHCAQLQPVIERGMAKRREDRFASAEEFAAAIGQAGWVSTGAWPSSGSFAAYSSLATPAAAQPDQPWTTSSGSPWDTGAGAVGASPTLTTGPHLKPMGRHNRARALAVAIAGLFAIIVVVSWLTAAAPTPLPSFEEAIVTLRDAKTCEERHAAVVLLRSLGDKRAIKHLKRARYRMRGGVLGIGDTNTNSCLREDAEAAIVYLQSLP
jgi:eukaryotic-like serine/threonine-protein kinase